jgi:hypothetical protein
MLLAPTQTGLTAFLVCLWLANHGNQTLTLNRRSKRNLANLGCFTHI